MLATQQIFFQYFAGLKEQKKMKRIKTFPFRLLTLMFQFVFKMFLKVSGCQNITLLDIYRDKKKKRGGGGTTASPARRVSHILIHFIYFCHTVAWWAFA